MANNNQKWKKDLNRVVVVGKLHSMNLEERPTKAGDKMTIIGDVTVQVVRGEEVNLVKLKVMATDVSKNYKAYKTVMEEYKSIQTHGAEEADVIEVSGNAELNEYLAQDGTLKGFNVLNASFFHRLSPTEYKGDMAILDLTGVLNNISPQLDREGMPTGYHIVNILSLKYNGATKDNDKVNELKDLVITEEGAEVIQSMYAPGDTVGLSIDIHRSVVVKEQPQQTAGAWGRPIVQKDSYKEILEIVGVVPTTTKRSEEQVEEIKRLRKVQKADLSGISTTEGQGWGRTPNATPTTTPSNEGFDDQDMPF